MVRKRTRQTLTTSQSNSSTHQRGKTAEMSDPDDPHQALLGQAVPQHTPTTISTAAGSVEQPDLADMETLSKKSQWIVLAIASGACAAFNGVFAKLTTTELTTSFATWIANLIGLSSVEGGVEVVVRVIFFLLNLLFNGIMWALFTKALARGTSTTQVSIINTSSNFMITAVLGFMIFSESLPPLWFLGAALLVAGNVIIGRREEAEGKKSDSNVVDGSASGPRTSADGGREGDGLLGEEVEFEDLDEAEVEVESERERKRKLEEQDILELDPEGEERRNDLQLL